MTKSDRGRRPGADPLSQPFFAVAMGHEIYYTSAPEGVRPGQHGFCTVATSPAIPKPLWDRLESISGYRHATAGGFDGAAPVGPNPVAWAHWLVQAGGKEVSVLSRICDAGLDYTQRTNFFAHHVALEAQERAAGGPAWVLLQPGLMARSWDGHVGTLARPAALPRGDAGPAVCTAWQRLTGDAGWAGVLAETAVKNPRRPVCILFQPGQDLLPLMAEAIALLPARTRWQVTFNTYFTSLPANAECAWRCCVAGTPAAAEARRHATGWLVLDLSAPSRMGGPPAGPWVELARAGRGGPAGAAPAVTKLRPPAAPKAAEPVPLAGSPAPGPPVAPLAVSASGGGGAPLGGMPVGAAVTTSAPETLHPHAPHRRARAFAASLRRGAPVVEPALPEPAAVPEVGEARALDTSWSELPRRPRRLWVIGLCGLALAFIGAGTWLQLSSYRESADRPHPQPPTSQPGPEVFATTAPAVAPIVLRPHTRPSVLPETREAAPLPAPPVVVMPAAVPAAAPPAPVPPPAPILLGKPLLQPADIQGAGVHDPRQMIAVPARGFDDLRAVASLRLLLPGRKTAYDLRADDLTGTLTVKPDPRNPMRQILTWRDANAPTAPIEVGSVLLERPHKGEPKLEVTWKPGVIVNQPGVSLLAHALLRQGTLVVSDARGLRPQEISFPRPDPILAEIGASRSDLAAEPMPPGITLVPEHNLPLGWEMTQSPQWEPGARHSMDSAGWVLQFKSPTTPDRPVCDLEVRIAPHWRSVQSNWSAQHKSAVSAATAAREELSRLDTDLAQAKEAAAPALARTARDLADATTQLHWSDKDLADVSLTREDVAEKVKSLRATLQGQQEALKQSLSAILDRRQDAQQVAQKLAAGAAAYERFKDVDLAVELSGGVRIATVRLTREKDGRLPTGR